MTERELRKQILSILLDYRDKSNIDIDEFCSENKIEFSSDDQKERIFHSLKDSGYINSTFYMGGGGFFTITSNGIDAAEDFIAERQKARSPFAYEAMQQLGVEDQSLQQSVNEEEQTAVQVAEIYKAQDNYQKITDKSIDPCFGVKTLTECFVKQLDSAINNDTDNVCMVGIFAPWGRGKSYFFGKVKEYIKNRKAEGAPKYDIVEFNAWKFQETPGIWAYLFETLYKSKNWWFRFRYTIWRRWTSIVSDILIGVIPIIIAYIVGLECKWMEAALWTTVSVGLIVNFLLKHYNSAISLIKKYSKGISFSNELGVQAEIEKELTALLKFWIFCNKKTNNNKVLLYADDVDRCSETKMISIIDSLRTVLENEEIRRRLIIVCSIDSDKVIKGIKHKYKDLYEGQELESIAVEQMDKIFLTGLALPQLGEYQLYEFISKLTKIETTEYNVKKQESRPYNIRGKSHLVATTQSETDPVLDNTTIHRLLLDFIRSNRSRLTPRKIRVIYYRILLANNIISNSGEDDEITDYVAKAIFDLSCGNKCDIDIDSALYDVVEMVVPYKYNYK